MEFKKIKSKITSKIHVEAIKLDPNGEDGIIFITKRLMPVEDLNLMKGQQGYISKSQKFGHFIWYNKIKLSKQAIEFMNHAKSIFYDN